MIAHHLPDGRRVYTVDQAAVILAGPNADAAALRRARATIRQRLRRAGATPAARINPRLGLYLPEDLGPDVVGRIRQTNPEKEQLQCPD